MITFRKDPLLGKARVYDFSGREVNPQELDELFLKRDVMEDSGRFKEYFEQHTGESYEPVTLMQRGLI